MIIPYLPDLKEEYNSDMRAYQLNATQGKV